MSVRVVPQLVISNAANKRTLKSRSSKSAQNIEPIAGRIWRQEIGNGSVVALGPSEELHGPFRNSFSLNVNVPAGFGFLYVFFLENESEWLFCANSSARKSKRLGIIPKSKIVVTTVFEIRCATLWMTPDAVLQDGIPYKSSSRFG